MLQPFKLFVLQELFALQVSSLCPWGGPGTAVPSDLGHLMGLWLSKAVQFSQGHGTSCKQHLSVVPVAPCKEASLPTAGPA